MNTLAEVLKTRNYKVGYQVRTERHHVGDDDAEVVIRSAYTVPDDDYIGDGKLAWRLYNKYGIKPEKADPSHSICSIGFCENKQKWYGWSHRAICGFGVGDIVKEGDCAAESGWADEYLETYPDANKALPVGFVAETLDDAKLIAIAFAESVS